MIIRLVTKPKTGDMWVTWGDVLEVGYVTFLALYNTYTNRIDVSRGTKGDVHKKGDV